MAASRQRRARIVDVARHAGVSAQTVSNVINGRDGFTEPTRVKVEQAIAELGFQPNRYAQSLRSQRTGLIGFDMVRRQLDVSNPFTVGPAARTGPRRGDQHDLRVLVFTHEEDRPEEFRADRVLRPGRRLHPLRLHDLATPGPRSCRSSASPSSSWAARRPTHPVAALDIDNAAAMREAVDHVVDQGCRDIAYVGYGGTAHWNVDRRRGVREVLSRTEGFGCPGIAMLTSTSLTSIRSRLPEFLTARRRPRCRHHHERLHRGLGRGHRVDARHPGRQGACRHRLRRRAAGHHGEPGDHQRGRPRRTDRRPAARHARPHPQGRAGAASTERDDPPRRPRQQWLRPSTQSVGVAAEAVVWTRSQPRTPAPYTPTPNEFRWGQAWLVIASDIPVVDDVTLDRTGQTALGIPRRTESQTRTQATDQGARGGPRPIRSCLVVSTF